MTTDKDETIDAPTTPSNMQDFASIIGAAVAQGIAANTPKKTTFGQYVARQNRGRSKLTRECYQNGFRMEASSLSNDEIDLLNKIDRTGRYINRMVEVIIQDAGTDEIVEIRFSNKTSDQRFELKGFVRNFLDMLQQITAAQAEERKEDEEKLERKQARRHFGDNKAFREASAKAGV